MSGAFGRPRLVGRNYPTSRRAENLRTLDIVCEISAASALAHRSSRATRVNMPQVAAATEEVSRIFPNTWSMNCFPIDVVSRQVVRRPELPHARVGHCLGIVVICCSMMAGIARAQEDWTDTRDRFICRSSSEVREIKTYVSNAPHGVAEAGFGCRVDYIKNGTTQTVWSSRTSRSYCDGKAAKLAARLETEHFSCERLDSQRSDKH